MKQLMLRSLLGCTVFLLACGIATVASAKTVTLRVVTYNIEDDIDGFSAPRPGLITPNSGGSVTNGGVLEGIGEEIVNGDTAQPIDILALQETVSNSVSVAPIVAGLNVFYSSRNITAGYVMSTYQATYSGVLTNGGGPSALVYNTNTVQLLASVGIGTPTGAGNGEYRQVVRYLFAPAGVTTNSTNTFYVYVSHYKAKQTVSDEDSRQGEAAIIRTNSATLPGTSRILYVGDYNVSSNNEPGFQTIVAPGINQGFDALNPTNAVPQQWDLNSMLNLKSESATSLHWRFDFQVMTSNILYGVGAGLAYVPGTYHVFGNNGTTPYESTVNSGGNTSLNGNLNTNGVGITASQLYSYLTTASDHLPMVADYTIQVPDNPPIAGFTASPTNGVVPLAVTFTDTSTGSITNRFWSFGDGGTTNVTTNSVTYTYAAAGTYGVTLIVNGSGGSGTNTQPNLITVLTPFQAWQVQYFGSTTNPAAAANADPDGDGQSNLQEFTAGTDPTNDASALRITSIVRSGNDIVVTWTMGSGKTNALQYSAGDISGNYSNNFADIFTVTNTVGTVTNYPNAGPATNAPTGYYRVRLVP